jgi:transposase
MSKQATPVVIGKEDRPTLEKWARGTTSEQRIALRSRIVLAAADGIDTIAIAKRYGTRPNTVSKWRQRYATAGLAGLADKPRPGALIRYGVDTERRVLSAIQERPPAGYAMWNGRLLAAHLGDVSEGYVWHILRKHRISLARRRSWCVSTDPEFAVKSADIVGLYLAPPENALVLCVDEKPSIQALERAQGWLRMPDGRAMTGYTHEYTRHGTTTLFAALETATGLVKAGHFARRRRREFLAFMNDVVASYRAQQELHVVLDNFSTHRYNETWLRRHPNVFFHFTPTHASWLNQVEIWFSILWRNALRGASFTSPRQIREAINAFIAEYVKTAHPFEWRKATVFQKHFHNSIAFQQN